MRLKPESIRILMFLNKNLHSKIINEDKLKEVFNRSKSTLKK